MDKETKKIETGIVVRKKNYQFEGVRRFWCADRPFHTHFWNMMNILFPTGEDFFIQSVQKYKDHVKDPVLYEEVKNFSAQEMQHSMQHANFLLHFKDMGYKFEGFVKSIDVVLNKFIWTGLLRLATTAAFEHYTAVLSHIALRNYFNVLAPIDPKMREMYEWHAAEELEHKSVAIDVLRLVNKSYLLRIAGMFVATSLFFPVLFGGICYLLLQDKALFRVSTFKDFYEFGFGKYKFFPKIFLEVMDYFRPGFHPTQLDDYHLAQDIFDRQAAEAAAV